MKPATLISKIPDLLPTGSFQHSFLPIWTPFPLLLPAPSLGGEGRVLAGRGSGTEGCIQGINSGASDSVLIGNS